MRRVIGVLVATIALSAGGCGIGRPTGFTARTDRTCADAQSAIERLTAPPSEHEAMGYALDRYVVMERAVATISASTLPGGAAGRGLRHRWLDPARASLRAGRRDLERLRRAVQAGELSEAPSAFELAATAGDAGVDVTVFAERALPSCRTVFSTNPPSISW